MASIKDLAFEKASLLLCKGYTPEFIDGKTNIGYLGVLPAALKKDLPKVEGNKKGVLNYTSLSVLYNKKRMVPFFSAYNIDGKEEVNQAARPAFRADPRIASDIQLDKTFYNLVTGFTEFEIGHMASNNEMGRGPDGVLKAFQTFHFTNSAPQAERLNSGLWKGLETYVIREAATVTTNKRISVFTGPVLTSKDPAYVKRTSFRIPLLFFKVVVFMSKKGLYSTAFVMSHEKKMIEDNMFVRPAPTRSLAENLTESGFFNDFTYRRVFQVNIPFLEELSGLKFRWKGVKSIQVPEGKKMLEKIRQVGSAADAQVSRSALRNPNRIVTTGQPSLTDLKRDNYSLNMVLP